MIGIACFGPKAVNGFRISQIFGSDWECSLGRLPDSLPLELEAQRCAAELCDGGEPPSEERAASILQNA